jgi:hypothetical protein
MDAVQRMRRQARDYGYLASNGYVNVVSSGGYIEIAPLNPSLLYLPVYDTLIVFAPPERDSWPVLLSTSDQPLPSVQRSFRGVGGLDLHSCGPLTPSWWEGIPGSEPGLIEASMYTHMLIPGYARQGPASRPIG